MGLRHLSIVCWAAALLGCGPSQQDWARLLREMETLQSQRATLVTRRTELEQLHLASAAGKLNPAGAASAPPLEWPDLGAPMTTADDGSKDAALIVAIEKYTYLTPIAGARHNAEDWERFLKDVRKVPAERVQLLVDESAVNYAIRSSLKELARDVKPGGKLWFVFIGHGAPNARDSDGLLVAVDAQQTELGLEERSVAQRDVFSIMGGSAGTPVVILDACFSGRTPSGEALIPGLQPSEVVPTIVPPPAVAITAAASNEFAGRLPGAERPAFSYLALGGLRGWADADHDGSVTASEIAAYARGTLQRLAGASRRQTPRAEGDRRMSLSTGRETGPALEDYARLLRRRGTPP